MTTVDRYMTRNPWTISRDDSLAAAHLLMRAHGIRHLPVVDGGRLVGILSQRDVHLIETLTQVEPEEVSVSDAMTIEVDVADPKTPLVEVVARMSQTKAGSVVVMDRGSVVGIFTTVDALRALARALTRIEIEAQTFA